MSDDSQWAKNMMRFEESLEQAKKEMRIMRGTARRNATWKEGDAKRGDVGYVLVGYVWAVSRPAPFASGQWPVVLDEDRALSSDLYDFEMLSEKEATLVYAQLVQGADAY